MPDTPVVDLDNLDRDGTYLQYHAARDENLPAYAQHRRDVRSLCRVDEGSTVFEIGCGTGAHLPHFARQVGSSGAVVGVDSSAKMLDLARLRLKGETDDADRAMVELVHCRLGEWIPDRAADVVVADRLIGHLPDPIEGLRQLGELCAPGGLVVAVNMLNAATTVNLGEGPEARALARRVLAWRSERGTTSAWAAGVLPSLARQAGLEPVEAKLWSFACSSLAETYPHTPLLDYAAHACADGSVTDEEATLWRELLGERERDGSFTVGIVLRADVLRKPA